MTEQAQLQAISADDLQGAVRLYDPEAVMIAPGSAPVVGAAAIRNAFEALLADPNLDVKVTPGSGWASASGELAVTTFTAEFTTPDPGTGKPVTTPMENQTVWRKARSGTWTIVLDANVAPSSAAGAVEPDQSSSSKTET